MSDPMERQRERELARRRENELKDLEVENRHEQRPLEGFSGAHTSWTGDQDDGAAATEHAGDEARSRRASEEQIPADASGGHTLPKRGDPESR
jgi:hypothetical protein